MTLVKNPVYYRDFSNLRECKKKQTVTFFGIFGNKNATSHIIQAISMTVQRGNAISIMGTLGPLRKLEDFFDVISPREEIS